MSVIWYSNPSGFDHVTPPGHPERVDRLNAVEAGLEPLRLDRRDAPDCTDAHLRLCHPQSYIDAISDSIPEAGSVSIDPDTHVSPGSLVAARHAVGGCVAAVDAVLDGEAQAAFVGCRPPGHHAETARSMGFCLFGNVAIAARYALERGLHRIAVIDFDVHHGNGTQDLLWGVPEVLFVSSHQMPLWPGSGAAHETGAHGQILNVPLPTGSNGTQMREAYDLLVFPRIAAHAPELFLISAGFDAHRADPLAGLNWRTEDYAWITHRLCDLALEHCGGRIVSTLEGGYDLDALSASVAAHVGVLKERLA
ncbi:histone deacetylase family protein [Palleronia caenipelagi]|uniref:Histone deacetylase family protein n=1 Tax=Palleronia caenipelagi TaxID=2489174 RepID=A0A547QA05_9RHOB|nr:histone deacetylase family protein [Palleronia caenipelagi]TRD23202.1 histone deacetylase family protein [Palleronia caenipelagi]